MTGEQWTAIGRLAGELDRSVDQSTRVLSNDVYAVVRRALGPRGGLITVTVRIDPDGVERYEGDGRRLPRKGVSLRDAEASEKAIASTLGSSDSLSETRAA